MEELKTLENLFKIDERHISFACISGFVPNLEGMHRYLSKEILNESVPDELKSQFNVAKNMALYSYFFYAICPEVHLKTYIILERALKIRSGKKLMLSGLLKLARDECWISDSGFRHLKNYSSENEWFNEMSNIIPSLRNSRAHGEKMLVGDCLNHISVFADFVNQLFPDVAVGS